MYMDLIPSFLLVSELDSALSYAFIAPKIAPSMNMFQNIYIVLTEERKNTV